MDVLFSQSQTFAYPVATRRPHISDVQTVSNEHPMVICGTDSIGTFEGSKLKEFTIYFDIIIKLPAITISPLPEHNSSRISRATSIALKMKKMLMI